ncbi:MAG: hypothetical protein WCW33_02920 [Candidatus Babeliales bacterium]|jgi:predicted oxidoreductase
MIEHYMIFPLFDPTQAAYSPENCEKTPKNGQNRTFGVSNFSLPDYFLFFKYLTQLPIN